MPPSEDSRAEGPFGEWTGYYASGTRNEPVVKVKNVFYRNNPIILGMPPGISGKSVALSAANVWLALEKAGVTDVQGVWEYQTRYITVISSSRNMAVTSSGRRWRCSDRLMVIIAVL